MIAALWTGGGHLPEEYVDLYLCREVYHCTPSQLDLEDGATVQKHLALIGAENYVKAAQARGPLTR